jgi:hypothetical protein
MASRCSAVDAGSELVFTRDLLLSPARPDSTTNADEEFQFPALSKRPSLERQGSNQLETRGGLQARRGAGQGLIHVGRRVWTVRVWRMSHLLESLTFLMAKMNKLRSVTSAVATLVKSTTTQQRNLNSHSPHCAQSRHVYVVFLTTFCFHNKGSNGTKKST